LHAEVADLMVVLDWLDVVNGATMRHKSAVDCNLVEFLYVPDKHHPIRIKRHSPLINFIDVTRYHISKFRLFTLRNLDFANPSLYVCRA